MSTHSRYHIKTRPAPPPEGGYPADFVMTDMGAYVKYGHPVFSGKTARGDEYWTAEIVTQTWYQAETGRIPISGAGYGGKFAGKGFEGIWLDMSEIVRPTRDGIHGREYISTAVNIGAGVEMLRFKADGALSTQLPGWINLPIPVIFDPLPEELPGRGSLEAVARAAHELGTRALIPVSDYGLELSLYSSTLSALITPDTIEHCSDAWRPDYLEAAASGPALLDLIEHAAQRWPDAVIAARISLNSRSGDEVVRLAESGVRAIHLAANEMGEDAEGTPLPIAIRAIHEQLVEHALRDRVTLIASGGIAAAEHVAKAIACGADLVGVDYIMLVAWGTSLWADRRPAPIEDEAFDAGWGAQRLVNLMSAWRDQLLEALGAMGMREVRRLRGELGRTIWFDSEDGAFRRLLGGSVPRADYPLLNTPEGAEGDFRWPVWLLLSTQAMARSGEAPSGTLEHRVGASDGGFDRLAFRFELEHDPMQPVSADPAGFDLALPLNRRRDGRPERVLPMPWYGAGMSYGSVGVPVMKARARAAAHLGILTSTGEGGYPEELEPYAEHIITQVATGLFGVTEATLQRTPVIEIKYAQGAKPGLGGHLLGNKNTSTVARLREAVEGTSLFSPFPFHSVYSVEDHKKHVDWLKQVNARGLVSVKVSTPTDVDMVAVGSYYAGAHIIHLDGAYGGTGAAPEIAKKNIAMPIEYAIPKVHRFLVEEGIRDEVTLMASGGIRTIYDVAKAIALGADGVILGTAELVAIGCIRIAQCEKGLGCPFGITTTDPEHARKVDEDRSTQGIINLYTAWQWQLAGILQQVGMTSIRELRGRSDLLVYLD